MSNRIVVVYKSSTGFTQKYAEMLAGKIDCTLAVYKDATPELLSGYDIVVFGTRAHAGRIDGFRKMKEMFRKSKAAKFVLFVTGAMPNTARETINAFWRQNFTADEPEQIPHFYMQSGLCYEKMSFSDKLMMKAAAAMIKGKKSKSPEEKEFERAIAGSYDISSEIYLQPLTAFLSDISDEPS